MKIYVISEGVDGPCKIGIGRIPRKRLQSLQIGNPRRLHLVYTQDVESALRIERMAHNFAGYANQLIGEWFSITEAQAKAAVDKAVAYPGGSDIDRELVVPVPLTEHATGIRYVKHVARAKTRLPYTPPTRRITLIPGGYR